MYFEPRTCAASWMIRMPLLAGCRRPVVIAEHAVVSITIIALAPADRASLSIDASVSRESQNTGCAPVADR